MTSPATPQPPVCDDGRFDGRFHAAACARNRRPILEVLRHILPAAGLVLEIAAGSGEHAVYFSSALPHLAWQPTDAKGSNLVSIDAWAAAMRAGGQKLAGLHPAQLLQTTVLPWPVHRAEAILCINMIHISPWEATVGLMKGAGGILPRGGVLYTYGPYRVDGRQTAESNAKFERWLMARDPSHGIRDIAEVTAEAERNGLSLSETIPMPANNFSLVFHKH